MKIYLIHQSNHSVVYQLNALEELVVFVAPKLLGGKSAMSPLNSFGFESISSTHKLQHSFLDRKGEDLCWKLLF